MFILHYLRGLHPARSCMFVQDARLKLQAHQARLEGSSDDMARRCVNYQPDQRAHYEDNKVSCLPPLPDVSMSEVCSLNTSLELADMPERCPRQPQAFFSVLIYLTSCLKVPDPSRGVMAGMAPAPSRCLIMHLQAEVHLSARLNGGRNRASSPLLVVMCCLTALSLLRRCFLALVLVLCSTSLVVGGRPQVKNSDAGLRLRRLAAAGPPIDISPTWTLPSVDPMQV